MGPSWEVVASAFGLVLLALVGSVITWLRLSISSAHKRIDDLRDRVLEQHPTHDDVREAITTAIRLAVAESLPSALEQALGKLRWRSQETKP